MKKKNILKISTFFWPLIFNKIYTRTPCSEINAAVRVCNVSIIIRPKKNDQHKLIFESKIIG